MTQRHWQGYCRRCGRHTLHLADVESVPHVVYALFTLLSCGLVALVWIAHCIVAASSSLDWRCSQCGTPYVATSPDRSTGTVLRVMGLILIAAFFALLLVAAKIGRLDNTMLAITSPAGVLGVLFFVIGLAASYR